ncbi:Hypothetical Protein SLY_0531 [Strawberry lethal yellows phytoplasma (CPA) str. NZSb11]|uniref:Uncharacterized protein n=1 Tax=Strawberry lethal yellows phytoplasma (CPA) str. NZSb11 TaxID=980422 RepID=R4RMD0_PHYAS|nr:Hypothetical Protein SLY_0531 [Strawberry lethal yellows phytoplasma (CPA) str. NZSb11]
MGIQLQNFFTRLFFYIKKFFKDFKIITRCPPFFIKLTIQHNVK